MTTTTNPTMATLALSSDSWDLFLDGSGNIAVAQPPYSTAQDVSSAIRTFLGECFYDTTIGVPYEQKFLGMSPPLTVLQAAMVDAALTVPGVVEAICIIEAYDYDQQSVVGYVQFTDTDGNVGQVSL